MDPYKENYNYKIIQQIEKQLKYQLLDQPFMIKEEDWLHKDDTSQLNTPVLPQTPQVKVAAAPQINQQTGLTRDVKLRYCHRLNRLLQEEHDTQNNSRTHHKFARSRDWIEEGYCKHQNQSFKAHE